MGTARAASAAVVRRRIAADLTDGRSSADQAIDDVVLVASELVGNAVRQLAVAVRATSTSTWDVDSDGLHDLGDRRRQRASADAAASAPTPDDVRAAAGWRSSPPLAADWGVRRRRGQASRLGPRRLPAESVDRRSLQRPSAAADAGLRNSGRQAAHHPQRHRQRGEVDGRRGPAPRATVVRARSTRSAFAAAQASIRSSAGSASSVVRSTAVVIADSAA